MHSVGYIKYGLLFHMIIGGLMYTNSQIIPTTHEVRTTQAEGTLSYYIDLIGSSFVSKRFSSAHSRLYAALLTVLLLLYVFESFIVEFLVKQLLRTLACACCRRARIPQEILNMDRDDSYASNDIFKEMEIS